jgi:G3E family GTPase
MSMASGRPSQQRIPVTLVTGFLGSGKTTLVNAVLASPDMAQTLVVVNEFGEVGLDHRLYASSNDAVVVLENGCLCCTVRSDLVSTLNGLFSDRQARRIPLFERVVIETSGLAEPGPILQAFLSEPTLDGVYRVVSVVALVDAVNWTGTVDSHHEAAQQIALADRIVITKLDLAAGGAADTERELRAELARMNPAATIVTFNGTRSAANLLLPHEDFDPAVPSADPTRWLGLEHYEHHHSAEEHEHHLHDRGIVSIVLTRDEPLAREELQFLLDGISQNLGANLLRVKGLVNVAGEEGRPAVIQGAQHLLHTMTWLDRWPDSDTRSHIVFITQGIAAAKLKEIIGLLDRMGKRTSEARERGRRAREAAERNGGSA